MSRSLAILLLTALAVSAQGEIPLLTATVSSHEEYCHYLEYGSSRYGRPWLTGCSSCLPGGMTSLYDSDNILDCDLTTAWVEGAEDDGIGQYFSFQAPFFAHYLSPETIAENGIDTIGYPVWKIVIYNGYQKSPELWAMNSRVRSLVIWHDDTRVCIVELADTDEPQVISIDDLWELTGPGFTGFSVNDGETVRFEIIEVYPGSTFSDTAVSEILIYGGQGG